MHADLQSPTNDGLAVMTTRAIAAAAAAVPARFHFTPNASTRNNRLGTSRDKCRHFVRFDVRKSIINMKRCRPQMSSGLGYHRNSPFLCVKEHFTVVANTARCGYFIMFTIVLLCDVARYTNV